MLMLTEHDYLQVHANVLLIHPSRLALVEEGIKATGCNAKVTLVQGDWEVTHDSDAPTESQREQPAYLVEFSTGEDTALFQPWIDAKQNDLRL